MKRESFDAAQREAGNDSEARLKRRGARLHLDFHLAAAALLITAWVLFGGYAEGIRCCNDGSTYALVKSIAHRGTFRIDTYVYLTEMKDVSLRGGHYYTDRPPGTAFLALPFYLLSTLLSNLLYFQVRDSFVVFGALLAPILAGVATVWLVYRLGLLLGARRSAALAAAGVYAFGSAAWIYSRTLFVHSAAALCVTAAVVCALSLEKKLRGAGETAASNGDKRRLGYLALFGGLAAGWSVLSDYQTIVLVPIYLVFITWLVWRSRRLFSVLAWWFAGLAVPLLLLAFYNWQCFGGLLATSYFYRIGAEWTHSPLTTYATPLWEGLIGLLVGFKQNGKIGEFHTGQVFWSPVLILAAIGYGICLARHESRRPALFSVIVMAAVIGLSSKHRTWWGGGTEDARYIYSVTPLWFAGTAAWIEAGLTYFRSRPLKAAFWTTTGAFIAATLVLRYIWAAAVVGANVALLPRLIAYRAMHGQPELLWLGIERLFAKWPRLLLLAASGLLAAWIHSKALPVKQSRDSQPRQV
jgi:4-amino-4-deoxy-L-arabinose transferase-like glycosyltransferase